MNSAISHLPPVAAFARRRFIQGAAAVGILTALQPNRRSLAAQPALSGTSFDLTIGKIPLAVTGKKTIATGVNGGVPGPILRWREGDTVTVNVTNTLDVPRLSPHLAPQPDQLPIVLKIDTTWRRSDSPGLLSLHSLQSKDQGLSWNKIS